MEEGVDAPVLPLKEVGVCVTAWSQPHQAMCLPAHPCRRVESSTRTGSPPMHLSCESSNRSAPHSRYKHRLVSEKMQYNLVVLASLVWQLSAPVQQ